MDIKMTGKIEIRKYKMSDAERVVELFANDKVLKNLSIEKKAKDIKLNYEKKWLKKIINSYKKKKPKGQSFAITLDGVLIGSIGFHIADYHNQNTEIGYWIGEEYWGKGYTVRAVKKLIKILFNKFKFVRIVGGAFSYNKASQRVLEKAGFKFEGERRKILKKFGKFIDDKMYAKVR